MAGRMETDRRETIIRLIFVFFFEIFEIGIITRRSFPETVLSVSIVDCETRFRTMADPMRAIALHHREQLYRNVARCRMSNL